MQIHWKDLLRLLAKEVPLTVASWKMKNGAEFFLAIPDERDILDNTLSSSVEFPFTFDEIEVLKIPRRIKHLSITNDVSAIGVLLQSIEGVSWQDCGDGLLIQVRPV